MSCEQAESHAVKARKLCEIENDAGKAALGVVQCSVEGLFIVAINDAACALDDVDASDVAGGERESHIASGGNGEFAHKGTPLADRAECRSAASFEFMSFEANFVTVVTPG